MKAIVHRENDLTCVNRIKEWLLTDIWLLPHFSLSLKLIWCDHEARGVLPYKRLMGMCRWMGSHFHDWIDYNGVAFSIELLEWGRTFSDFLG